jgi:hypothetical protein
LVFGEIFELFALLLEGRLVEHPDRKACDSGRNAHHDHQ